VKKHAAAWAKGLLKYGIGFGLLALVISKYWDPNPSTGAPGLRDLPDRPTDWAALTLAAVLMSLTIVLQLVRWYGLVRALDLPFTLRNAFRLGFVGVFFNTFFPGAVGGDLVKAYYIARRQPDRKAAAVATVIIDRALGLFGLILFVAVTGSVAWANGDPRLTANPDLQWMVKLTAGLAGGAVLGFLLLGLLPESRVDRFAGRLRQVPKLGKGLAEAWYAVWTYRQRPKAILLGVAISAVAHVAMVFGFHFASRGFPPPDAETLPTVTEHMVVCPIGFIVQALPISPAGVGVGEAAFAGLYKLCGREPGAGVLARLALRVVEWALALIGLVVWLRMKSELPVVMDEAEGEGYSPDDPDTEHPAHPHDHPAGG
jgi:uncharacterized membrane protein YbhN (UPF0104 family)